MKNILFTAIAICYMANFSYAQELMTRSSSMTIHFYDENNNAESKEVLEEAEDFDLQNYILNNKSENRISLNGVHYDHNEVNYTLFDSYAEENEDGASELCQEIQTEMHSFLGVGAYCTDAYSGVIIEKLVEESPAHLAGISIGDTIISFNGTEVNSYCALRTAIKACEVGQTISYKTIKNGKTQNNEVTIGAQIRNTINYHLCYESNIEKRDLETVSEFLQTQMSVYPNPSAGTSYISYNSNSTEPVKFYVIDINGSTIYNETFNDFSVSLKARYTFQDHANGTYLFIVEQAGKIHKSKVVYLKN